MGAQPAAVSGLEPMRGHHSRTKVLNCTLLSYSFPAAFSISTRRSSTSQTKSPTPAREPPAQSSFCLLRSPCPFPLPGRFARTPSQREAAPETKTATGRRDPLKRERTHSFALAVQQDAMKTPRASSLAPLRPRASLTTQVLPAELHLYLKPNSAPLSSHRHASSSSSSSPRSRTAWTSAFQSINPSPFGLGSPPSPSVLAGRTNVPIVDPIKLVGKELVSQILRCGEVGRS